MNNQLYTDCECREEQFGNNNSCDLSIINGPKDVSTQLGSYVYLSALVKANKPSFQWYNRFGQPIPNKNKNTLIIDPIKEEDFGFYRLEIIDLITEQRVLTRWVEIKDKYTYTVYKGTSFELSYYFDNATKYRWYKDGERMEGLEGNTLHFTNANKENNGVYVLGASNEESGTLVLTKPTKVKVLENNN